MIHATSKAVLVAWDMGLGPTFKGGARAHALYRVYRDGAPIGDTCAEAFYDANVRRGAVHTYTAFAVAPDGSETALGPSFTVHVPRVAPSDRAAVMIAMMAPVPHAWVSSPGTACADKPTSLR